MESLAIAICLGFILITFLYKTDLQRSWRRYRGKQADYFTLSGVSPPRPLVDFNIDTTKPRPYRPFRWEWHQTMSLKKMESDWWLELESTYRERIKQRKELVKRYGNMIVDALPGSEAACKELKEMVIQFLCARYPTQFQYNQRSGEFCNRILDLHVDADTVNPLDFLIDHVPEDFLITQEDKQTGLYVLTAGIACSAVGWNLTLKIGKPLHAIHGGVPDYKDKMQLSMDKFFTKLPCNRPIQRGAWSLEIGQPLFAQQGDPHFVGRDIQRPDVDLKDIYLRVDWQTLRRLPQSRAIAFNYKAFFTPITELRHESYIPKLFAKILREGKQTYLQYKSTYHVQHRTLPALDSWAKEQEEKGWVPKGWIVRTLDEDPFFPGWQKQPPSG